MISFYKASQYVPSDWSTDPRIRKTTDVYKRQAFSKDLFESMKFDSALEKAVQFYATMFFFYSMYDGAEDKEQVKLEFETSLRKIAEELYENEQAVEEKVTERNGKWKIQLSFGRRKKRNTEK